MYFDTGTIEYENYLYNFDPPLYRVGTISVKPYSEDYKALAVIKYDFYGMGYTYDIICAKQDAPLIIDPEQSIANNVSDYRNHGWLGESSYTGLYDNNQQTDDPAEGYPPYVDPETSNYYSDVFSDTVSEGEEDHRRITKSTIPIFTISNDNVAALNSYILTGDFSGADNASDLMSPTLVHETEVDFLSRHSFDPVIHAVQGDDSVSKVNVKIHFNGVLTSISDILNSATESSIKIRCSNGAYVDALGLNPDGTELYFLITKAMTVKYGKLALVIEIKCDDKVAHSSRIILDVDRNPLKEVE